MKATLRLMIGATATLCMLNAGAQQRYLSDTFSSIKITPDVTYNTNRAVNLIPPNNPPIVDAPLLCDVYEPVGDPLASRPLVILMHTGSYLPAIVNRQTTGSKSDSTIVEMCRRFARKGYVAVGMNYRVGWNPTILNADTATAQLLQATYRGIQDAKNCVRFFKENAATYGIDTNKIVLGGQGTGGYIALAYASVNKQTEIELEKFRYSSDPFPPMVDINLYGDWDGYGGNPFLNTSGNVNHSGKISMVFHYGGALGDTSWMEGNEVPIVSMQCVLDPFAPYEIGNVIVPTTGVTVINQAAGAATVQRIADRFGINEIINNRKYQDPYSLRAAQLNGGFDGLYPFILPARVPAQLNQGSPWEWWDSTFIKNINFPAAGAGALAHQSSMLTNPDMSEAKAKAYIDTIQGFLNPRVVCALGLPGCADKISSINPIEQAPALLVYPNPNNNGLLTIRTHVNNLLSSVSIIDLNGKEVKRFEANGESELQIKLDNLNKGLYFVKTIGSMGASSARLSIK